MKVSRYGFLISTASIKQPKNSLQLHNPARKIAIELITVFSDVINLQSKHDLICHTAKVKAAVSLSMAILSITGGYFPTNDVKYILHTIKKAIKRNEK